MNVLLPITYADRVPVLLQLSVCHELNGMSGRKFFSETVNFINASTIR
jgi:hypothetical protein